MAVLRFISNSNHFSKLAMEEISTSQQLCCSEPTFKLTSRFGLDGCQNGKLTASTKQHSAAVEVLEVLVNLGCAAAIDT